MKLKLYSLDVFLNELMYRGIKDVYYYFEEYDTKIMFSAMDEGLVISYVLRELPVTCDKLEEIKKLEGDLPTIRFRKGILE